MIMSHKQNLNGNNDEPINFGTMLTRSASFEKLYFEGMQLMELSTEYIDTQGPEDRVALSEISKNRYTVESIHLLTRCIRLTNWLIAVRSLNDKDENGEQKLPDFFSKALHEKDYETSMQSRNELPPQLKNLINWSLQIKRRIILIDNQIPHRQTNNQHH